MNPAITRRSALKSLACGFGSLALADMLNAFDKPPSPGFVGVVSHVEIV